MVSAPHEWLLNTALISPQQLEKNQPMLNDASPCLLPPAYLCVCVHMSACVCVLPSLARRQTAEERLPECHHLWMHLCLSAHGVCVSQSVCVLWVVWKGGGGVGGELRQ